MVFRDSVKIKAHYGPPLTISAITMPKLGKRKSHTQSVPSPLPITSKLDCEFCDELTDPATSRFRQIYGSTITSRLVDQEEGFVAMPTIGQLFKSSLLILPRQHIETMAQTPSALLDSLFTLLDRLERRLVSFGLPILFEHGAKCITKGGCGIHHAHFHLVPVPKPLGWPDVLPDEDAYRADTLVDALTRLQHSDEYVLFRDTYGHIAFLEITDDQARRRFPSQYFRRQLVQHFHRKQPWDWHEYNYQEPWLLEAVQWFGMNNK